MLQLDSSFTISLKGQTIFFQREESRAGPHPTKESELQLETFPNIPPARVNATQED
jgi:hypothetical protein